MAFLLTIAIISLIYCWLLTTYFKYDADYELYKKEMLSVIDGYIFLCSTPTLFDNEIPRQTIESVGVMKVESKKISCIDFSKESSFYSAGKSAYFFFPLIASSIVGAWRNWGTFGVVLVAGVSAILGFFLVPIFSKRWKSTTEFVPQDYWLEQRIDYFEEAVNQYRKINVERDSDVLLTKHARLTSVLDQFNEIKKKHEERKSTVTTIGMVILVRLEQ